MQPLLKILPALPAEVRLLRSLRSWVTLLAVVLGPGAWAAAPTDISLSSSTILENNAVNAAVGNLSATDADGGAPSGYSYSLVSGGADNSSFNISGSSLRASASFNYETISSYGIRVRVTDPTALTFDKNFTITVGNRTEVAPTVDAQLLTITENSAAASCHGSVVATDTDGDSFTFSIVDHPDPTDPQRNHEGLFTINANTGQICIVNQAAIAATYLDFERALDPDKSPDPPYQLEIRATDRDGRSGSGVVTINLGNVYEPPYIVQPAPVTLPEHSSGDIATIDIFDPDSVGAIRPPVTFSLTGTGHQIAGADVFAIDSASGVVRVLRPDLVDHETHPVFSLSVRISDNKPTPSTDTKTLTVNLTDTVPQLTTASLFLVANSVNGTVLGRLDVNNPDGGTRSFAVTQFTINGTPQPNPSALFHVDDRDQLVLDQDAVKVLAGVNLDNSPELKLTLQVSNGVGDSSVGILPLILQSFPGGSPIMLDVTQGVNPGVSGRTEGDPVQDVAVGPNSEIIAVGSVNGRGYLKVYPRGISHPRVENFEDNFIPTAVVADTQWVYVAGHTGSRALNWKARLMENQPAKVEPPGPGVSAIIYRFPLKTTETSPRISSHPFGSYWDSVINDMALVEGRLFVCGGIRNTQVGAADPYPYTYEPIWARLDSDLYWRDGRTVSPNNPSSQSKAGFGWLDSHHRAYYSMFTTIAVAPDDGDLYLGGYNLTWHGRDGGVGYGNGWLAHLKRREDGSYGDAQDSGDAPELLPNETWIADQGDQDGLDVTFPTIPAPRRYLSMTFIKDLVFVKGATKSTLYALQEYRGKGLPYKDMYLHGVQKTGPGYDNETNAVKIKDTNERSLTLKIARFSPSLGSDTSTASAYIQVKEPKATELKTTIEFINIPGLPLPFPFPKVELVPNEVRAGSMTTDAEGNLFITGMIPAGLTVSFGPSSTQEALHSRDRFFVAKYNPDLVFQWVQIFADGAYTPVKRPTVQIPLADSVGLDFPTAPQRPPMGPLVAEWHPRWQALLVGGNFTGGQVETHLGNEVNWVTAPAGGAKGGFLTLLSGNNSFVKSQGLVIQSIAETDGRPVGNDQLIRPYLGGAAPAVGDTITVEVPKYIYAERDSAGNEVYLGTFENPPGEEVIRSRAVTRYVNLGITVGNREFHSDSTSYSFVFQEGTTVTINWRPEHAVTIDNDLRGTGATLTDGLWIRAAEGLGLTSTAAGLPEPVADKHWIKENELFTGFINGFEGDPSVFGTRYAVLGYDALGYARTDGGSTALGAVAQSVLFDEIELRHQVTPFVVRGPSSISWKWKPQHRVQISTTSSRSEQLPRIDVADASGQDDFLGVGEAWYDRNTLLTIGARDDEGPGSTSQRLLGWLNSLGQFRSPPSSPGGRDLLTDTFIESGRTYVGHSIPAPGLAGPTLVVWNYGDTIYHEVVTLGSAVLFSDPLFPLSDITSSPGRPRQPDRIRLVEAPAGSTGADMADWDDVTKKLYPVRPGVFFAEWDRPNSESKIVLEIRSGFGGDRVRPDSSTDLSTFGAPKRHYRHLSHPDMPLVTLDPDLADAYALLGMRYTESDGLVADGSFTAQRAGRHVVVFSQSNVADVPAVGDRTTETLLVRVIETRRWNAEYSAANPPTIVKGAWSDAAGSSMLMDADPNSEPAIIGRKVTSSLDTAGLETGFVISSLARYNVNIYDRTRVAGAGPIIPVNRHFVGSQDDDLMIVWYEHAEANATVPANILWPWQSVRYQTRWPEHSDLTLVKDPGGADVPQPVDRIVVASRLGSEGHNDNGILQTFFDRERYSAVRIYEQGDRTQAGYNPNEEHAVTAPSFKFLDQANPPTAAFALRNDLNVTTQNSSYTSDPYVLVEYFDQEEGESGEFKMAVYQIELEDDRLALNPYQYQGRDFPYTFNYPMKAGEPVQPPYPLGLVIGLTPCQTTSGENISPGRVYWEDYKGQAWAVAEGSLRSFFFYPQAANFWNGEGSAAIPPGECIPFRTAGPVLVTGRIPHPVFSAGQSFSLNGTALTLTGTSAAAFVAAVNAQPGSVDARVLPTGEIRLTDLSGATIVLVDGVGSPLIAAGITAPLTARSTTGVTYHATWPETLPILKIGETLTFAGGEYKADNPGPEQPGLPGVVAWAAGRVVFDSRNPAMDNQQAFDQYAARLIAPLEDRFVQLTDTQAATLEEIIQPANKLTSVVGVLWKFNGLSASIGKRMFYDPLRNRLLIRGFLNDRTLGDSDLTATPPPVYVLEPDILTASERDALLELPGLEGTPIWTQVVSELFTLSRNPEGLAKATPATTPYYAGLELDVVQENNGDKFDAEGRPVTIPKTARHKSALGPGLALVASPRLLEPGDPNQIEYVTLAENDDRRVGGPVSLFIVKIEKKHRYRGAIKTILSDNVFDEKITLRHTADFGANGDDIVYQWFYREEDGAGAPLPPDPVWKLFADQRDSSPKGLGLYQISVEGTGGLILADNLFFLRYRHREDVPADGINSVNWAKGSPAKPYGTEWNRDGAEFRDPEAKDLLGNPDDGIKFGGEFAGAANSPTVDQVYRAQLVMGWIKRVLDRVNPYEARFSDFRNNTAPATYASMIQEAGQAYVGPVALNPDKDVIENVGLIELYQTVLDRGVNLSIGLSSPITTPGINNALLLAATRISDLYALMGNEAYSDALDPTIGFVSGTGLDLSGANPGYGSLAPALFAFQNQVSSLIEEELALLRGVDDSYARPVNNRLFWNLTKGEGEVAYAMNYNIKDVNQDGFIDENDARLLYPQGHGDAWGHYLTALKTRYALLKHPFFNWQTRSEFYNLWDPLESTCRHASLSIL